jgi:hypothetical protein
MTANPPSEYSQLKAFWKENLLKIPEAALSKQALSPATRKLLTEVGLPKNAPLLLRFYDDARLLSRLLHAGSDYLVIGDDEGTKIGIRAVKEDVWSVDPENQLPLRFINSSLEALLTCLQIYLENQVALRQASDDDALKIVSAMRERFSQIDAQALAGADNWWSVILEQTEAGLL